MTPMKHCFRCLAALLLWFSLHDAATAAVVPCTMTPTPTPGCSPACQPIAMWPTFLLPPPGTPVGTTVASTTVNYSYRCPAVSPARTYTAQYSPKAQNSAAVPGARVAHQTLSTLGVRIYANGQLISDIPYNNTITWYDVNWAPDCNTASECVGSVAITYELVITNTAIYNSAPTASSDRIYCGGGIGSGPCQFLLTNFDIFRFYDKKTQDVPLGWVSMWNGGPSKGHLMAQTCTVTTKNVYVHLDTIKPADLAAAGNNGAGTKNFNIGLHCQSGSSVYVTLTDLTNTGNGSDLLTLSAGSTASGVKLRILRNNGTTPVYFGKDSIAPGNPGQWFVGPSASTTGIPLAVQYVATGAVQAGMVYGVATFTMSYQ